MNDSFITNNTINTIIKVVVHIMDDNDSCCNKKIWIVYGRMYLKLAFNVSIDLSCASQIVLEDSLFGNN